MSKLPIELASSDYVPLAVWENNTTSSFIEISNFSKTRRNIKSRIRALNVKLSIMTYVVTSNNSRLINLNREADIIFDSLNYIRSKFDSLTTSFKSQLSDLSTAIDRFKVLDQDIQEVKKLNIEKLMLNYNTALDIIEYNEQKINSVIQQYSSVEQKIDKSTNTTNKIVAILNLISEKISEQQSVNIELNKKYLKSLKISNNIQISNNALYFLIPTLQKKLDRKSVV